MKILCALGFELQCQNLRLSASRVASNWMVSSIRDALCKTNIVLRKFCPVVLLGAYFARREMGTQNANCRFGVKESELYFLIIARKKGVLVHMHQKCMTNFQKLRTWSNYFSWKLYWIKIILIWPLLNQGHLYKYQLSQYSNWAQNQWLECHLSQLLWDMVWMVLGKKNQLAH